MDADGVQEDEVATIGVRAEQHVLVADLCRCGTEVARLRVSEGGTELAVPDAAHVRDHDEADHAADQHHDDAEPDAEQQARGSLVRRAGAKRRDEQHDHPDQEDTGGARGAPAHQDRVERRREVVVARHPSPGLDGHHRRLGEAEQQHRPRDDRLADPSHRDVRQDEGHRPAGQPAGLAKSAGLRSDTGPVTSPPVTTSATTWKTMVASSTQPPRNRAVCQVSGRGERMAWVGVVETMEGVGASVVIRFLRSRRWSAAARASTRAR